ncbi:IS3 family transposase [Sporomusa termitida]
MVRNSRVGTLEQLKSGLDEYVQWFNEKRLHSTLGYLSPLQYKSLNKTV